MLKDLILARTQIPLLAKGLDALGLRQKAIAKNIANAQTIGYKRELVAFEEELKGALNRRQESILRTHPKHLLPRNCASVVFPVMRAADNRVDGPGSEEVIPEREMADLAQTQIKYEAEVRVTRHHIELIKMAIRGTG